MILQDKAGCGILSCQLIFITDVHFHSWLTGGNAVGKIIFIHLMIFFCPIFFFENLLVYLYFLRIYESGHFLTVFSQVILVLFWRIEEVKVAVCFVLREWEKKLLSLNTCNTVLIEVRVEFLGVVLLQVFLHHGAIPALLSKEFLLLYTPSSHGLSLS